MTLTFPENFMWGVATASYQIEGAVHADGRGESIWDRFSHTPAKTVNGDTGDAACDHYHRYAEDIALMKALGAKAYRLSVAWPRIVPDGKGAVNEAGLGFYDRLIDEILRAGITPYVTLYHWDLPQTIQDEGGWVNRASADYFARYADVVSRCLGDRVKHWATFNEPWCIAYLGYAVGAHAPGIVDMTFAKASHVSHHVNLAHGKAVPILRANSAGAKVGIVLNMWPVHPASANDIEAVHRVDGYNNRWFADPIFKGEYPADCMAALGSAVPNIKPGDMETISAPIDMLGVNYYTREIVRDDPHGATITKTAPVRNDGAEFTEMDWEVYPDGLREILTRVWNDYQPKEMYVTENGCAMPDAVDANGQIHDPRRVDYLCKHFASAHRAITEGVPLKGYFVWTMMDNFEWGMGYSKRFGLVYVDYATQRRTPKASYHYVQQVIRANAVEEA